MRSAVGSTTSNFSGDISFQSAARYTPRTEQEVLAILDRHADGTVRVIGAGHSWNEAIISDDVLVDLRHLNQVTINAVDDGTALVTVGGGGRLKRLVELLRERADVTVPTMGLITQQTIAGAISTGTHGSGRHSLSHYVQEMRVAAYQPDGQHATIHHLTGGNTLRAARCAIGCAGIILSVTLRCPKRYLIAESLELLDDIDEVLAREDQFPLQQSYLIPHLWKWYNQQRRVDDRTPPQPSRLALLYRFYWLAFIDAGLHMVLKLLTSKLMGSKPVRWFYRWLFPWFVPPVGVVSDWSERQLIMKHELFNHFEMELFVPRRHIKQATSFVQEVLQVFGGTASISDRLRSTVEPTGLLRALESGAGTFNHHYPICFRRVLPDDTMISMASGTDEPWYAISLITYQQPRTPFTTMATLMARTMAMLFGARPHWGKFFPLEAAAVDMLYPNATIFREACRSIDPRGVFRNEFVKNAIGL